MSAEDYTYRVFHSNEDNAFVATVCEFPSLSCVEDSREAALAGLTDIVQGVLEWMEEEGETIPVRGKIGQADMRKCTKMTAEQEEILAEIGEQEAGIAQKLQKASL